MALKVKAKEKMQKIGKFAGTYRYVLMPELYTSLAQEKVIREAALRSGVSHGVMQACWNPRTHEMTVRYDARVTSARHIMHLVA